MFGGPVVLLALGDKGPGEKQQGVKMWIVSPVLNQIFNWFRTRLSKFFDHNCKVFKGWLRSLTPPLVTASYLHLILLWALPADIHGFPSVAPALPTFG